MFETLKHTQGHLNTHSNPCMGLLKVDGTPNIAEISGLSMFVVHKPQFRNQKNSSSLVFMTVIWLTAILT